MFSISFILKRKYTKSVIVWKGKGNLARMNTQERMNVYVLLLQSCGNGEIISL